MSQSVDDELIEILENFSLSIEARSQGWNYLLSLSASDEGLNHIATSKKYIPFILSYVLQENDKKCTELAYKCLINISTQEHGAFAILASRKDFCGFLLHTVCDEHPNPRFVQSKCFLLANLSTYDEIAKRIFHILKSSKDLFQKLIKVYCLSDSKVRSQYDFITLVFANVSRQSEGRRLFIEDTDFITSILNFTKCSESESRRLGTALILRNCCLESDYHDLLLKEVGILPAVILPLMTRMEYEEGREMGKLPPELQLQCLEEIQEWDQSLSVRRVLIQALILLCYSENGWKFLKSNGVYYVVRELHKWEKLDSVTKDIIEHLVNFLLVVKYSKPTSNASFLNEDSNLIKELESDMIKDLPDIVI